MGVNNESRVYTRAVAITPNDSTELEGVAALFIGTGGSLVVEPVSGGNTVTFTNVANATLLPVGAVRVLATGTTASGIIGLF